MDKKEIMSQLQSVMRDVFDNESIIINENTSAEDINEWDSLSHIQLIVGIEKTFNIKLTSKELMSYDNVGEIVDNIQKKLA